MNVAELTQNLVQGLAASWWQQIPALSLQIAVLVAIVALLTRLARPWSAQLRYALWTVVVARLAFPFGFRSPLGLLPAGETAPASFAPSSTSSLATEAGNLVVSPVAIDLASAPVDVSSAVPTATPSFFISWDQGLVLAWAAIVFFLGGLWIWRHHRIRSALDNGSTAAPANVVSLAASLATSMGLRRPVKVQVVNHDLGLNTPAVFGILQPRILLPRELAEGADPGLLEPVLLHELTHLRRRDHWVNALQGVVQILYFFHPVVWWANRELRRERELACDEAVVHHLEGDSRSYVTSLLELARRVPAVSRPALPLPAMAANRSFLRYRLERLTSLPKTLRPRRRRLLMALVLVVGIAASLVSAGSSGEINAAEGQHRGGGEVAATTDGQGVATIVENRTYGLPEGALADPTADLISAEPLRSTGPRLGKLLNPTPPKLSGMPSGRISGWIDVDREGRVEEASLLHSLNPQTDEEILAFLGTLEFEVLPPPRENDLPAVMRGTGVTFLHRLVLTFQLENGRFVLPPAETAETS